VITPYFAREGLTLHHGDCREVMAALDEDSVAAIVTDPPYDLTAASRNGSPRTNNPDNPYGRHKPQGFMGKEWDGTGVAFDPATWRAAYRVLKPGGFLLAFGGARTYHRMACAIEEAGFAIVDSIHWLYGNGFPKSLNLAKAIDRELGQESEVVGEVRTGFAGTLGGKAAQGGLAKPDVRRVTAATTPEAQAWEGWGTALKPGHEPIVVAQKPREGTYAANVLAHGVGGLNIEACRTAYRGDDDRALATPQGRTTTKDAGAIGATPDAGRNYGRIDYAAIQGSGRWPANVLLTHAADCRRIGERRVRASAPASGPSLTGPHQGRALGRFNGTGEPPANYADGDGLETIEAWACAPDCPVAALDAQSGFTQLHRIETPSVAAEGAVFHGSFQTDRGPRGYSDAGGASRFFPTFAWGEEDHWPFRYVAKPPRSERNEGLGKLAPKVSPLRGRNPTGNPLVDSLHGFTAAQQNIHPTVKPVALMRWLVRLVTPPGGTCLDPFLGSGTTGVACVVEGRGFVGIELEAEYLEIARGRVDTDRQRTLF